eukprot:Plantae.Rhodophyta-Hildenbrandia_rubra.ctg12734.p3 GENE.Plantae.Rhodophyta-Hildenbrandia_rubra.ctg12734~~Plantae.Rhodophyta-Hildenbrandia_rubra.ctg12734.p3  ORF type:complete len:416 (+),score=106.70 Plantae.Rhodophyta-Hildenbrandia_rubra.ctg12734:6345-7592(+)
MPTLSLATPSQPTDITPMSTTNHAVFITTPFDVDDIDWDALADIGIGGAGTNPEEDLKELDDDYNHGNGNTVLELKDDPGNESTSTAVTSESESMSVQVEGFLNDNIPVIVVPGAGHSGEDVVDEEKKKSKVGKLGVKKKVKRKRSEARKLSNNIHTRKCREKLNTTYANLLAVLPPPVNGVSGESDGEGGDKKKSGKRVIKHKAQILAHAVQCFREIQSKNSHLEMELALASKQHLGSWISALVTNSPNIKGALDSFMKLICMRKEWKYAELWIPKASDHSKVKSIEMDPKTRLEFVSSIMSPGLDEDKSLRLANYRKKSKLFNFAPREGVPGRVFLTKRPEWLPWLRDPVAFPRAPFASQYDVQVTFAVPVIIDGKVAFCVEFYDTEARDYDPQVLHLATDIAARIGKAFGKE